VWLDQGHMLRGLTTLRINPAPPAPRFVLPPDPVDVAETSDTLKTQPVVAPVPQIPDAPEPIRSNSITQPIEPPAPETHGMVTTTIPNNWGPGGHGPVVFDPSMLDQQPSPRFQAKPAYPIAMKQEGRSGSVLVD